MDMDAESLRQIELVMERVFERKFDEGFERKFGPAFDEAFDRKFGEAFNREFGPAFDEAFDGKFGENIKPFSERLTGVESTLRLHSRNFDEMLLYLNAIQGDINELQGKVERFDETLAVVDIKINRIFHLYPDRAADVAAQGKRLTRIENKVFPASDKEN